MSNSTLVNLLKSDGRVTHSSGFPLFLKERFVLDLSKTKEKKGSGEWAMKSVLVTAKV